MNLLTIETTCDETAAAVVTDELVVLSSVIASQDELHKRFRGVVPELAARIDGGSVIAHAPLTGDVEMLEGEANGVHHLVT